MSPPNLADGDDTIKLSTETFPFMCRSTELTVKEKMLKLGPILIPPATICKRSSRSSKRPSSRQSPTHFQPLSDILWSLIVTLPEVSTMICELINETVGCTAVQHATVIAIINDKKNIMIRYIMVGEGTWSGLEGRPII
jgi:hypothetical protein